jgi:hypothetical protein
MYALQTSRYVHEPRHLAEHAGRQLINTATYPKYMRCQWYLVARHEQNDHKAILQLTGLWMGCLQVVQLDDALLRGCVAMKAGLLLEEQGALKHACSVLSQVPGLHPTCDDTKASMVAVDCVQW